MRLAAILVLAGVLILPALPMAGAEGRGAPITYVVGFYALPGDHATYKGNAVVGENAELRFFRVTTTDPQGFEAQAKADANVRYFDVDAEVFHATMVPNDTFYNQYQYDMKAAATNMEAAWDRSLGTTSVKLCIVDTGQNRGHEDLSPLTYFYWKDEISGKATPYDDNGHGSHTTGTAAAKINNAKGVAGIAAGASIGGIKVLNRQGSGTFTQVANGITDGKNAGCHIESLSLGAASTSQALNDAVAGFINGGGFMAAAAGNDGPCTNCVGYPGKLAGVTAVSCSASGNAWCSYSSEGPEVDVIAPGDNIASTWSKNAPCQGNGVSCYVLSSGTSMSTPHVAGLAALYMSTHAGASGSATESAIKAGARNLGFPAARQGAGLVQGTVV